MEKNRKRKQEQDARGGEPKKPIFASSKKRGNNSLKGKPSNNKGKKRATKVPRRSALDMEIRTCLNFGKGDVLDDTSDVEEQLTHAPLSIHMYRSAFIKAWCKKLGTRESHEDSVLKLLLEHGPHETNCIYADGEPPSSATVDHLRTKIYVKGKVYQLPPVKREADRNIRPYHYWMYNSNRWTREQLATMSKSGDDAVSGSHVCGGHCLNHAIPEPISTNNARKKHHSKMLAALEKGNLSSYLSIRNKCNHDPKCFINPGTRNLTETIKKSNANLYQAVLETFE